MRYLYFLGFFILAGIFAANPARADAGFINPAFATPLMQWVEGQMNVKVPYLPRIAVSRDKMVALIGNPERQAALARALYVPNLVVIDEDFWNERDTRTVSFLVHELVHHAQAFSGKKYACNNAKEWDAYRLQNLWLAQHNLPPAVENSWIDRMAQCG